MTLKTMLLTCCAFISAATLTTAETGKAHIKTSTMINGQQIPLVLHVDYSETPELETVVPVFEKTYRTVYAPLLKMVGRDAESAIKEVFVTLKPNIGPPAYAHKENITISADHLKRNQADAIGVFIHELTHTIQNYGGNAKGLGWFVEGAADYTRYKLNPSDAWAERNRANINYNNPFGAYWSSTAFLMYLEDEYNKDIVLPISKAIIAGGYKEVIWKDLTGKDLKTLAADYKTSNWKPTPVTPAVSIIPQPVSIEQGDGPAFALSADTPLRFHRSLQNEVDYLAAALEKRFGSKPQTYNDMLRIALDKPIVLNVQAGGAPESYTLISSAEAINITGPDAAGVFYGIQSLLQLIPLEGPANIPHMRIEDEPRFSWRGMHLDVGRHMFAAEDIKKFIDQLAVHKLNNFHWHLTEDQGWRIEIKKHPKLTEIGGYRASTPPYLDRWGSDGQRYGGYYTQEEIKDIVAYAAARHITVVPEIDMPGHMAAAIAAYPWLGNDDIPDYNPEVKTVWGVHPFVLAPKEETFQWIDDVLEEVCALFPSKYIHIGGDEAPKKQWKQSPFAQSVIQREGLKDEHELQAYFIQRVEDMLTKRGRKLIGWDEIREGGLSENATMMLWRGWEHAIASVNEGHDVVMAPTSHTYFDHYQNTPAIELAKGPEYEAIGGHRTIESVYSFNPIPEQFRGTEKAKHILGCQAQLWTEYMKTWDKVEYMAFPRVAALAEVSWTPQADRNFENFMQRLKPMLARYQAQGIRHFDPFNAGSIETRKGAKVVSSLQIHGGHLAAFMVDGNEKTQFWTGRSPRKGDEITITLKESTQGTITVATGGKGNKATDRLENGVLEASADETTWTEIAKFENGTASGDAPTGTTGIRIRVTGNQNNWLIIREVDFQ